MIKKKTYIPPSAKVIVIKNRPQLLVGSGNPTAPTGRFIDLEEPDYEWDVEGAG